MALFNITYETITPESAMDGAAHAEGFFARGVNLSMALAYLQQVELSGHMEANESPITDQVRWVKFYGVYMSNPDELVNYSLHFPEALKGETRKRLAEFLCSSEAWQCIF